MNMLAYGAQQVRTLELALGGKPPEEGAKQAAAELNRHVQEQFEHRKANFAHINELLRRQREPFLDLMKANNRPAVNLKEGLSQLLTKPRERPTLEKIEPRMVTGSGFWLKTPPFDHQGQNASGNARANPNGLDGTYSLEINTNAIGGSSSAWAGLAIDFFATEDNPFQRVAALVDYDYAWIDGSDLETAHNDAATNIWIWGFTEKRWVWQQNGLSPSWSDGTSWFEVHTNEDSGRETLEVFFPAFGKNWYQVWVWSWGSCDDAFAVLASSVASQWQRMRVPFVVFGQL